MCECGCVREREREGERERCDTNYTHTYIYNNFVIVLLYYGYTDYTNYDKSISLILLKNSYISTCLLLDVEIYM